MNERLKELAEQAGLQNTLGCFWQSGDHDLERFAELVRQDYLRELLELKPVAWIKRPEKVGYKSIKLTFDPPEDDVSTPLYALEVTK